MASEAYNVAKTFPVGPIPNVLPAVVIFLKDSRIKSDMQLSLGYRRRQPTLVETCSVV